MKKYPALTLSTHSKWFDEQCYVDGESAWLVETLWEAAKKLPIYEVPVIAMQTDFAIWDDMTFMEFLSHVKLVNEADMDYPIILTPGGNIADGRHRFGKAIVEGRTTVKVQRLAFMPDPDFGYDTEGNTLDNEEEDYDNYSGTDQS